MKWSERSEPKRVCRRNALAFFGYAAAFGLVASSAILTASQAEAQTTTTPATPTTPPADAAKSGTERRQERRTGRAERRQERRTGRTERRQERRTGRDERRDARDGTPPPPPSKKSNRFIRANNGNRAASAQAAGRPYSAPPAQGHRTPRAGRASAQAATGHRSPTGQALPNAHHVSHALSIAICAGSRLLLSFFSRWAIRDRRCLFQGRERVLHG